LLPCVFGSHILFSGVTRGLECGLELVGLQETKRA